MINMKRIVLVLVLLFATSTTYAMKADDHSGHTGSPDHYKHMDKSDGVEATFQVMSLASMKMKDPEGKTHHIMVSLSKDTQKLKQAAGEIVVVSPSGKKQTGKLAHFGGGMYAANFTFDEEGKWDVTCHFTDQGAEYTKHFSYQHHN